jgi:U3 small nucleolar RNA-associated protein 3
MGKRRNTAKTGDKGIYKARNQNDEQVKADVDDDPMYTKVDRFHNERDEFLKLDAQDSSPEDSEEEKEAVMDLGIGGGDDESSDDDDGDEDDKSDAESSEEGDKSSDSENEDDFEMDDVRDWGTKKTAYYHGDTADLEIGQEEDDAYLEEEAAKEVQAARYEDMSEEDFVLSDTEKDEGDAIENLPSTRDMSKLSTKDRHKILEKQHPEMLPLISYFSGVVQDLDEKTSVATKAIFEGEDGSAEVRVRGVLRECIDM